MGGESRPGIKAVRETRGGRGVGGGRERLLGCLSALSQGFAQANFLPGPNTGTTPFPPFFQIHSIFNIAKGGNPEKESWAL